MKLGFIGVGQMASAILSGVLSQKLVEATEVGLYDLWVEKMASFQKEGCAVFDSEQDLVKSSQVVIIAVKPQDFPALLPKIKPAVSKDTVIVSIAAGITGDQIQAAIGFDCKVVLAMPNTPLILAKGATGLAKTDSVTPEEFDNVKAIFSSVGIVEEVDADQLNNIIAVSGSTPAFVYKFAEQIVEFAKNSGLDQTKAMNLFAQTLVGSAQMLTQTGKTPQELITMVCSPGGTTIEGMKALEQYGFDEAIQKACEACVERAKELSELDK